ncbi:nucleotidyltransferase family protein [Alteromonas gracilis]|uniref:nucleotidyltransferase family protein n=1 Tax=Alteromonas gracilis TaxID=1479524 RepID=UPI003735D824
MRCLQALRDLDLPQGYIGAGFVRNAIWDELHNRATTTPLNDIDVVYFHGERDAPRSCATTEHAAQSMSQSAVQSLNYSIYLSTAKAQEFKLERELARVVPQANWQVKNQARMHLAHSHSPYRSCCEAISYWIERETCVAVRLTANDDIDVLAPFGLSANFASTISINPAFPRADAFKQRITAKNWQRNWPLLNVVEPTV